VVINNSVLVHEHILVDFAGASQVNRNRYDSEEVFRVALPKLADLRKYGCRRFLDCTPEYLGRDPRLLKRLEDASEIEIWTNTGLYGAGNGKYLPDYAKQESPSQLADRWIREFEKGVEGVKPRFIKIGVNGAPLSSLDKKLVEAAAITSRETGLTIMSHTGSGAAAMEQLEIFNQHQRRTDRFVWAHAQSEKEHDYHWKVASMGAWVEFDGVSAKSARWHQECVEAMAYKDQIDRTLISQDAGWYHVGEPGGGEFRGYTYIYTNFLPGLFEGWQRELMVENPRKAFH